MYMKAHPNTHIHDMKAHPNTHIHDVKAHFSGMVNSFKLFRLSHETSVIIFNLLRVVNIW